MEREVVFNLIYPLRGDPSLKGGFFSNPLFWEGYKPLPKKYIPRPEGRG